MILIFKRNVVKLQSPYMKSIIGLSQQKMTLPRLNPNKKLTIKIEKEEQTFLEFYF